MTQESIDQKRAPSYHVQADRTARQAVAQADLRLGTLQRDLALLTVSAAKLTPGEFRERADRLRESVRQAEARLSDVVDTLPSALQSHGRVMDARRAIEQILTRIPS